MREEEEGEAKMRRMRKGKRREGRGRKRERGGERGGGGREGLLPFATVVDGVRSHCPESCPFSTPPPLKS